ncbi:MAG TPA: tRNA (adenine(22)-N(1))-methyltransferase TrmK [Bacillales bacterium]|nr:tRNA (adenine(22)-N(1))-methyltransferase TrmK [Bacillales bacterium]
MNEIKLSKRLQAVADAVPEGASLADIGSDHAYLPCFLSLAGKIRAAIAGEVAVGPYSSAKSQVDRLHLGDVVSVRLGDGLEVIRQGEVDVVVIAGMGGPLIADILQRGKEKLSAVRRLVLQPNVEAEGVRTWLVDHGWELRHESILEEDGHIYEILTAEPGNPHRPYVGTGRQGLLYGPFLMKERNSVFLKKWRLQLRHWKKIEKQMIQAAETEQLVQKKRQLRKRIAETEELLNE